jgi:hypothetical protein
LFSRPGWAASLALGLQRGSGVPRLLFDETLKHDIERARGFLERQEMQLSACAPGPKLFEQAAATRPDVLLASDRGWEPWEGLDELRSDPELRMLRILFVSSRPLAPERREALVGANISILDGPTRPEDLANAVAAVMNVPTRVTVRTRVVFEVTGRTESDEVVYGRMLDISTGGMLLECSRPFERGDVLHCFFTLGPSTPVIFATARIIHGRSPGKGRYEYGLEFVEIRLDDRRRIAEFVFRQSGLQAMLA